MGAGGEVVGGRCGQGGEPGGEAPGEVFQGRRRGAVGHVCKVFIKGRPFGTLGWGSDHLPYPFGILPECGRLRGRLNDDSLDHGGDSEPVGDGDKGPAGAEGGGQGGRVQGQTGRCCHHARQQRLSKTN